MKEPAIRGLHSLSARAALCSDIRVGLFSAPNRFFRALSLRSCSVRSLFGCHFVLASLREVLLRFLAQFVCFVPACFCPSLRPPGANRQHCNEQENGRDRYADGD
jgi:hypothetical protein